MATVLVPLAEGCEELEAVTLIDLLRRAEIDVTTAALKPGPVHCSRGVVLLADTLLDDVTDETFDMILLPGGLPGADHLAEDPRIRALLQRHHENGRLVGAICAAPKALAAAGLLQGRRATAYPGVLDNLPSASVEATGEAVTWDERVATSRGPGTAMDFALSIIERLRGKAVREQVEAALVRP